MTDNELEAVILDHWLNRSPRVPIDEIQITIRGAGAIQRFVLLRPGKPSAILDGDDCHEVLINEPLKRRDSPN